MNLTEFSINNKVLTYFIVALLVVGGRNDEMCKVNATPFLNDIFIFLLD